MIGAIWDRNKMSWILFIYFTLVCTCSGTTQVLFTEACWGKLTNVTISNTSEAQTSLHWLTIGTNTPKLTEVIHMWGVCVCPDACEWYVENSICHL